MNFSWQAIAFLTVFMLQLATATMLWLFWGVVNVIFYWIPLLIFKWMPIMLAVHAAICLALNFIFPSKVLVMNTKASIPHRKRAGKKGGGREGVKTGM